MKSYDFFFKLNYLEYFGSMFALYKWGCPGYYFVIQITFWKDLVKFVQLWTEDINKRTKESQLMKLRIEVFFKHLLIVRKE
jgi:hypothetical protein